MKSLELNWIRKKVDKTIPIPEVMFFPFGDGRAGSYYHPNPKNEIFDIDGKPHSMKYGVIVLNPKYINDYAEEHIAHEWRHHWQCFNGMEFEDGSYLPSKSSTYEQSLWDYFTGSKLEMDALRFQYKYAGVNDIWEETLYPLIKDLRIRPIITYANNTLNSKPKIQSCSSIIRHSHPSYKET
jgi:hypothetical protein